MPPYTGAGNYGFSRVAPYTGAGQSASKTIKGLSLIDLAP